MMTKVYLRALSTDDLNLTYKWHTDETLYSTLGGPFRHVSMDVEKEWLQSKVKFNNQEINLMICLKENDQSIGLISVREIDWIARKGYLAGIFIGEQEYRGKGYGSEALQLMVHHCFSVLGLNRIWAQIFESNVPSIKTFHKCGFEVEGHLRQHVFKDGKFRDVLIVGLLANQYSGKEPVTPLDYSEE